MLTSRRVSLVILLTAFVAALPVLLVPTPAAAQKKPPPDQPPPKQPDVKPGTRFSAIKLIESDKFQKDIDNAIDAVEGGDYDAAVTYLQGILNNEDDVFVKVEFLDEKGIKKSTSLSVKFHANNLIASLPKEGLDAYELRFGADARRDLDKARATGSRELLGKVASQYRHTKAGAEANELLATSHLDRGEWFSAALRYERLLGPDPAHAKVSDLTLYKAALAFKRAGDNKRADEVWDVLRPKIKNGLLMADGKTVVAFKQVDEVLKESAVFMATNPHDWPMDRGNLARNAQAKGSPPILDFVLWSRPTLMDKNESGDVDAGAEAKTWLDEALDAHGKNTNMPLMPGAFPIATNGILYYRTYAGVSAVFLHDTPGGDKAGDILFKSTPFEGALGNAFGTVEVRKSVETWVQSVYRQSGFNNLLYENSNVGTLTTDNRNVYAVDDLAVPIPPKFLLPNFYGNLGYVSEAAKILVEQNVLCAFDLNSGKGVWRLGGKDSEFAKSHFLCAPVSIGGKLYVLNEKNTGDLRLLCLEQHKSVGNDGRDNWTVKVVLNQKLGTVKNEHRYIHDIARRANAIHLAYSDGILVCPTNAGEIIGVDLLSRSLAWAYKYRERPPAPNAFPKQFENTPFGPISLSYSNWKASPPVIVDGKVVFTAPDANSITCLNLRDGAEVWSAPQHEADLFLAGVYEGKVVIVGKNSVRALRLADGAPMYNPLLTGDLPSGQGVASNNIYYLPLKKGEIVAIDLKDWMVKAHNRAKDPSKVVSPGNLVFAEGLVISQTPTAIIAYPQLVAKLEEAVTKYAKEKTPENLLNRAELYLADGQVHKAVDDLVAVLKQELPQKLVPQAKKSLYDALSDLLQVDFVNTAGKYLDEYKQLTQVEGNPQEQLQRETKYWRIVAQGREAEGNLVDAFIAYKEYGASPLFKTDGIPSVEDPLYKVPTHLWLRGRISAMFEKAKKADQRAALEGAIAKEWLAVKKKNDMDAIRQFTGMFDVPFTVGREARLELADLIIQKKDKAAYLEAELNLQQLRVPGFRTDAAIGGKALEALARLEMAKGTDDSLRLAASYYREINKDFGNVVLRDGKTGADLFNALAQDPRLRPFLEEPGVLWANTKFKERTTDAGKVKGIEGFIFQPEGDLTPVMQQYRLVLNPVDRQRPQITLIDIGTNTERWKSNITTPTGTDNRLFFDYLYAQTNQPMGFFANAKYRFYQVKGHLAVVQVGMVAYGIDLDTGATLWNYPLYDAGKLPPGAFQSQVVVDEQGMWVVHQTNNGMVKGRVGHIGSVQATYVALITSKGLVVLDPLKGTPLWTKSGLATNTDLFGDDQHIYYVETAEGAAVGAGRCLRASDGALVDIPDFGFFYRNKQRILHGRQILTAEQQLGKSVTMRLYDVPTGKELWKRTFDNDPAVLQTEDPNYCGVIERDTGKLILLDATDAKEILKSNMKQYRVDAMDLKELHQPLLLDDGEQFYVALNTKWMNPKIWGNSLSNNFSNGTRCLPVNGWFCCLDRKGEFLWHGDDRYMHQMIVVEQFKSLPILIFTSRYLEPPEGGKGVMGVSRTGAVHKSNGFIVKWFPERQTNGNAQFYSFSVDVKAGTINLIGYNGVIQFYPDDKREPKKEDNKGGPGPGAQPDGKKPGADELPPPGQKKDNPDLARADNLAKMKTRYDLKRKDLIEREQAEAARVAKEELLIRREILAELDTMIARIEAEHRRELWRQALRGTILAPAVADAK
jgi:outer membrane protein assembly factor BamB